MELALNGTKIGYIIFTECYNKVTAGKGFIK